MTFVNKHKKIVILMALILISFVFWAYAADNSGVNMDEVKKSNPFALFSVEQTPQAEPQEGKPELFVETATLKFLDARSLKASITNMLSEFGSMEPDSQGNSLIICDTNENLAKILEQIRKIDRKPEQIMIEVVLLDVKLDNETEIGVNWDLLTTRDHHAIFRQNLGFSNRVGSTLRSETTLGTATAYNTTGTGSDLWLLWPGDIRTVIHALQEKNNVEILASPRVMVVSGQTANIEAVEEIPYQEVTDTSQGGTAAMTSTEFKNVGIKLNVGATLTDDKFILLKVETEQNVYTGALSGVPVVDTRKIQSSLLLEDSQILVIGGLRRKQTQRQTEQLPFLGDLPLIGFAFKSTDTVQNSSELLVILSPHIYKGEKPTDVQMEKYNEITQRPLLAIPEVKEKQREEEKEKARKAEEEEKEKARKAEEAEKEKARKAEEAEKAERANKAKEVKKAEQANRQADKADRKAGEANKKAEEAKERAEEAKKRAEEANKKSGLSFLRFIFHSLMV
jgi:type II secretory pathway component GspD/PulD (secretin)